MADKGNSDPGTCGTLNNPGNAQPSTLNLKGQAPYLMIEYAAGGADPLTLIFDGGATMTLCPGSTAYYTMKGIKGVEILYTGVAKFTWCWTDETAPCGGGK